MDLRRKKEDLRIIFMGTPEFAVPSLHILLEHGYNVVAVITSVDKFGGRGRNQLIESAVKQYAVQKDLKILQPRNLKSPDFIEELRALNADLQIVVAFRMLPEIVWNMPPLGTYNMHASLLPKYRGAAPINWAIINGEKQTGVTSFKLKHEIDTGSILMQRKLPIGADETAGELHDRMKSIAAVLVLETVRQLEHKNAPLMPQDNAGASHAPKLTRENTQIEFDRSVDEVYNFIRGLSPYPLAWFNLGEKIMKVIKAEKHFQTPDGPPGTLKSDNRTFLHIATKDAYISLREVKYEGKKNMEIRDFLNGFNIEAVS